MNKLIVTILLSFLSILGYSQCGNTDFELGNFTGWAGKLGTCCPINLTTNGLGGSAWYTFGSFHTGNVMFGFGDGSIRSLRKGIAPCANTACPNNSSGLALQRLSGKNDGQVVDFSTLGQ